LHSTVQKRFAQTLSDYVALVRAQCDRITVHNSGLPRSGHHQSELCGRHHLFGEKLLQQLRMTVIAISISPSPVTMIVAAS
jgi:hypothetical protein